MDVEVVFTGLCAFLNVNATNESMPDPSVILVRGDDHDMPGMPGMSSNNDNAPKHMHVAFIAYDSKTTKVSADPDVAFEDVQQAQTFKFLRLDGVQVQIEGDDPGTPNLPDNSYRDLVARKDEYWPEVKNKWNRDYVPEPAMGKKPSKTAVAAYLRFGSKGNITAGKVSPFPWQFPKLDGTFYIGNFAEEVVYSG